MGMICKELEKVLPQGIVENKEDNAVSYDIYDVPAFESGEYLGRVGGVSVFKSKDKGNDYVRMTIGTVKNYEGRKIVHELDRVWLKVLFAGSDLVNVMTSIGAVEGGKFYPQRAINRAVKFVIKCKDVASADNRFQYAITNIEPIDNIPEDRDFKYVRVATDFGFKYVPVATDAKSAPKLEIKGLQDNCKIILPEEDDDFLNFDEE